jgi:hypothetical protein
MFQLYRGILYLPTVYLILYLQTVYYIDYILQCQNVLKRAEKSIVLIVFNGVLCEVPTYTVSIFTVAQGECI